MELAGQYRALLWDLNHAYSSFHIDEPAFVMDTTEEEVEMIKSRKVV